MIFKVALGHVKWKGLVPVGTAEAVEGVERKCRRERGVMDSPTSCSRKV